MLEELEEELEELELDDELPTPDELDEELEDDDEELEELVTSPDDELSDPPHADSMATELASSVVATIL